MSSKTEAAFSRDLHASPPKHSGRNAVITGVLGVSIVLSLVLAFQTRNQNETTLADGGTQRIESVGGKTTEPLASEQGTSGNADAAAGLSKGTALPTVGTSTSLGLSPSVSSSTVPGSSTLVISPSTIAETSTTTGPSSTAPQTTTTTAATTTTEEARTTTTVERTTTTEASATTVVTLPPARPVSLVNGGFDEGVSLLQGDFVISPSIPGWVSQASEFEVWDSQKESVGAINGTNLLELNARVQGLIYQDFETTPGSTIRWEFFHRGREGTESLEMQLGSATGSLTTVQTARTDVQWRAYTGLYEVPAGQTKTRIVFRSLEPGGSGNFLDAISVALVR